MNIQIQTKRTTVRNLAIFTVGVLGIGWIGRGFDVLTGSPSTEGPGILLWIVTPLAASLLLRLFAGDGWNDFGIKPNFKGNFTWYIVAFLVYPVVTALLLIVGQVLGWTTFPDASLGSIMLLIQAFALAFLPNILKNFFEEAAWRGYLAPKVYSLGLNDYLGHLIVGFVWGAWHIPYYLFFLDHAILQEFTTLNLAAFIPLATIVAISWAFVYGEIRLLTNSIWPAVLMHAVEDALLFSLILGHHVQILPGTDWLISPMNGLFCAFFFLLIAIVLRHLRLKNRPLLDMATLHPSTMKKWISVLIILALLDGAFFRTSGPAAAQNAVDLDAAAVDAFVEAQMKKHNLPGVAVAITQGEEIVYLKGYGTTGSGQSVTPQTPFFIGSISKPVTSLAVMQLVEEGKIDLNAPVQTYLPWFTVANEEASRTITIRNLLNHTSGLSDAGFDRILPPDITREEAVRALSEARLTAPVGRQTQYFNHNFTVLSLVAETVTGQPFEVYLQQTIFDPLDMDHTHTYLESARADGLSAGYTRFFGVTTPKQQEFRAAELGAGYIISSAEDMAHFMIAQINGGQYEGTAVLSPKGINATHWKANAQGFGYGMGWFINKQDGYRRIEHGGSLETFKSNLVFFPERQTGVVILINQGHLFDAFISRPQMTEGLVALILGKAPNSEGLSMNLLAVILVAGFLATVGSMIRSLLKLPKWKEKAASMSRGKLIRDVGLHFLVPTVILIIIASQVMNIFGDRLNPSVIPQVMVQMLPDMALWLLVGTLPDYGMGIYKLVGVLAREN